MTKDTYEKSMRSFLQHVSREDHAEAAKALGMAMLADVAMNACAAFAAAAGSGNSRERREEALRSLVKKQATDPRLWFDAVAAHEAYLQKALRELHAAIEGGKN